jgi:hypothetical protein
MKRFWHLLNSKSPLHDGIIWASESSIAAVGFTLVWVAMHAFLVRGIVTGKMGWYNLRFDPVFYWIQVISGSLCLIGIDLWFLYGVIQARKQMGPNKRPEGTPEGSSPSKPGRVPFVPHS